MNKQEYINLRLKYFEECKEILFTKFGIDIGDTELITAKCSMCCIFDRKNGRMFLFEKNLKDGTTCNIFKR